MANAPTRGSVSVKAMMDRIQGDPNVLVEEKVKGREFWGGWLARGPRGGVVERETRPGGTSFLPRHAPDINRDFRIL